jgi:hypothetical protein
MCIGSSTSAYGSQLLSVWHLKVLIMLVVFYEIGFLLTVVSTRVSFFCQRVSGIDKILLTSDDEIRFLK